jgi:transcriptional regulator with XRE-family HTH domain
MAERVDAERGRRIERLMDLQGWKPTPLARVMRVDRTQVYNWKAGRAISSDSLERLAVALETTRLYIETGEGEPHYPRGAPPELLLRQLAAAADEFRGAGEPDPEGD